MTEIIESEEFKNLFPPLTGDDFDKLVKDIDTNGQTKLVTLNQDNILIDGYQRKRACDEVGIDVQFEVVEFRSKEREIAFVMSHNLHRRHLTDIQKAAAGSKLEPMLKQAAKERMEHKDGVKSAPLPVGLRAKDRSPVKVPEVSKQVADLVGLSEDKYKKIQRIKRVKPEAISEIEKGNKTVGGTIKEIRERVRRSPLADVRVC